ncbi:uncharacterized protein FIBRA_02982 [Fibroporia radiculosa]|uniref:PPPDE domain-containing protein n=1 Tax=Fibroporia radiculosa TaxID=599839 RepID=J4GN82_9APHY|nr:uncharacterized protein FIBRA_02982 [Fibroporia radiculosa]CCM00935.1 predicted protein [Fibroporia radiculosa]
MANVGVYTLQVTQSWRGKDAYGNIFPLHWALTIRTSGSDARPIGKIYNAAGNIDTFFYETLSDAPLTNSNWRGDLKVGNIPADALPAMERILEGEVPVVRNNYNWNCQNWVWSALRRLRQKGFNISPTTWDSLVSDMNSLLDAWESGDI